MFAVDTHTVVDIIVSVGVAFILWVLRGIREDVQAIIKQQVAQNETISRLHVELVGDYVKRSEHETSIKGLYDHIDEGRKNTEDKLNGISGQVTELKVAIAKRRP